MVNHASTGLTTATLKGSDHSYPKALLLLSGCSPPPIVYLQGNIALLHHSLLALFCSRRCPGRLIVTAQDWIRSQQYKDSTIIGGFHTPVEKECLRIHIKKQANTIVCPARGLPRHIPKEMRLAIANGAALYLSFFDPKEKRVTAALAGMRNRYIAAMADSFLFIHAPKGSNTFKLAELALGENKTVWTFEHPSNLTLIKMGANVIITDRVSYPC